MLRTAYILSPRADAVWFLALPFASIAAGMACQAWLTLPAVAAVGLWITAPHHFATWVRAYGQPEERRRWRWRLFLGPLVILYATLSVYNFAPLSLFLFATLWDHQHSIMQQHGFARIYDFKAGTGLPSARQFDLAFNWVLFVNLLITSPLFTAYWVRELYLLQVPVSAEFVRNLQGASWIVCGAFLLVYVGHAIKTVSAGAPLNPMKFAFLGASYFLWYFCAWQTSSFLVDSVAHRLMHGLQYIVFVWWYMRRKSLAQAPPGESRRMFPAMLVAQFVLLAVGYSAIVHLLSQGSLSDFGFGLLDPSSRYRWEIPAFSLPAMSLEDGFVISATLLTQLMQLTHYYVDSFIWKVGDKSVQKGL